VLGQIRVSLPAMNHNQAGPSHKAAALPCAPFMGWGRSSTGTLQR
jgi:hypothetical protein